MSCNIEPLSDLRRLQEQVNIANKLDISFRTCTNGYQDTIPGPGCNHLSIYNWIAHSLYPAVKILNSQPPSYYSLSSALCGFRMVVPNLTSHTKTKLDVTPSNLVRMEGRVYRGSRKSRKTIVRCQFKKYKQIKSLIVNYTRQGFVKT